MAATPCGTSTPNERQPPAHGILDSPHAAKDTATIVLAQRTLTSGPPWLDTAISWALLYRAAAGTQPETLRLFRPARVVALGPSDRLSPGFDAARVAARAAGFTAVDRLAGGRAALFHEQTIAFAWTVPDTEARAHIRERYEAMSNLIAQALRRLGVDARVGAVPGEYCPGDYSVNARGATKLMGVGQRVFVHAAHVGGVICVDGAPLLRDVLTPVYASLGLAWDPATSGSVADELGEAGTGRLWDTVFDAILDEVAANYPVEDGALDSGLVGEAWGYEEMLTEQTADGPARR